MMPAKDDKATCTASQPTPCPTLKGPRVVRIGLNLISILNVDDKDESFLANVLLHYVWDPRPTAGGFEASGDRFWRPFLMLHNLQSSTAVPNEACKPHTDEQLIDAAKRGILVRENVSMVARFSSPMALNDYPYDLQKLHCVIVLLARAHDGTVLLAHDFDKIRCRNEAQVAQEWEVIYKLDEESPQLSRELGGVRSLLTTLAQLCCFRVRKWGEDGHLGMVKPLTDSECWDFSAAKRVNHALCVYRIGDKELGHKYHRLECFVVVRRQSQAILKSVLLPTIALSLTGLCVYARSVDQDYGERTGNLIILILTILANSFLVKDRLPMLAYLTPLDAYFYALQGLLYLIIFFSAVVPTAVCGLQGRDSITHACVAHPDVQSDEAIAFFDGVFGWVSFSLFLVLCATMFWSFFSRTLAREEYLNQLRVEGRASPIRECVREHMWWAEISSIDQDTRRRNLDRIEDDLRRCLRRDLEAPVGERCVAWFKEPIGFEKWQRSADLERAVIEDCARYRYTPKESRAEPEVSVYIGVIVRGRIFVSDARAVSKNVRLGLFARNAHAKGRGVSSIGMGGFAKGDEGLLLAAVAQRPQLVECSPAVFGRSPGFSYVLCTARQIDEQIDSMLDLVLKDGKAASRRDMYPNMMLIRSVGPRESRIE